MREAYYSLLVGLLLALPTQAQTDPLITAWQLAAGAAPGLRAWLVSPLGQVVSPPVGLEPGVSQAFDLTALADGVYFLWLEGNGVATAEKVIVTH